MWITLTIAATSLAVVYASFPDEDSSREMYPRSRASQLVHVARNMRQKRMNPMSCRCCSNSFNSHCCLKCMHRLGKRGDNVGTSLLGSQSSYASGPAPTSIEEDDGIRSEYRDGIKSGLAMMRRLEIACYCCLEQTLKPNPLADLSACCQVCDKYILH